MNFENVFVEVSKVKEEKGGILLIHGLGEHSGRYKKFIDYINNKGYSVVTLDLPGFGKSPGKRGHVEKFDVYYKLLDDIVDKYGNKNMMVMGHSMGGLIAARYVQTTSHKIKALILSGAATKLKPISKGLTIITKILDSIAPSITFGNKIDANDLSYNEESNRNYVNDPLVHDKISARLFWEMKRESINLYNNIDKINIPVLIIHGKDDPLVPPKFSEEFFNNLKTKEKNLVFIENAKHESMNEKDGEKVYKIIYNFITKVNNEG